MIDHKPLWIIAWLTMYLVSGTCMAHQYPGVLCVIEGIDGSGKTTLLQKLKQKFNQTIVSPIFTKEPGATQLGTQLRTIILEKTAPTAPLAQFLLFSADRAQHFEEVIVPHLKQGHLIISDRMSDSSLAYQGYFKGLDLEMIKTINTWCMQHIKPDIIFYLKVDTNTAITRIKSTRTISDQFEQECLERMQTLVDAFDQIFAQYTNVITIDATMDSDTIADTVFTEILKLIPHTHET